MDKNFERLLQTLSIVSTDQFRSAPEVRELLRVRGINVSLRTVQRDLQGLAQHYDLDCKDESKPFSWRWRKDRPRISIPGMDWPEAVSFRLLEDYLTGLLPASVGQHLHPYFEQARRRLSVRQPAAFMQQWPDKVRVLTPGPSLVEPLVTRAVHDAVSEALLGNQQLEIDYRSVGNPQPKRHVINPLGLVMEGRTMYLVASYLLYNEPRTLALHRMERAVVLATASAAPAGFSLKGYVDAGGFGCGGTEQITLDATWHDRAGIHLIQSKLAVDQVVKELDADTTRIKAKVLYTERLVWWLLSFGERVEVHGPRKVREEIARIHRAAARHYAKPKRKTTA